MRDATITATAKSFQGGSLGKDGRMAKARLDFVIRKHMAKRLAEPTTAQLGSVGHHEDVVRERVATSLQISHSRHQNLVGACQWHKRTCTMQTSCLASQN